MSYILCRGLRDHSTPKIQWLLHQLVGLVHCTTTRAMCARPLAMALKWRRYGRWLHCLLAVSHCLPSNNCIAFPPFVLPLKARPNSKPEDTFRLADYDAAEGKPTVSILKNGRHLLRGVYADFQDGSFFFGPAGESSALGSRRQSAGEESQGWQQQQQGSQVASTDSTDSTHPLHMQSNHTSCSRLPLARPTFLPPRRRRGWYRAQQDHRPRPPPLPAAAAGRQQ